MSEQTQCACKRNWKIWALVAVLVIAGGGYAAKTMMEKRMVSDIETFMATLPEGFSLKAETIKVDVFSKSAALTKISGSGKVGNDIVTITADSADGSGLNLRAFKEKGVTTLADSLSLRNLKVDGAGFTGQAESYHLEKVQGDFVALAEQTAKMWSMVRETQKAIASGDPAAKKKTDADIIALTKDPAFSAALDTLSIGRAAAQKYQIEVKFDAAKSSELSGIKIVVDSVEGKDYSTTRSGPVFARGMAMDLNGTPLFSLEEMSLQGADLPSQKDMAALDSAEGKAAFKKMKMSLKDLRLKKLNITLRNEAKDTITLAGFDLNFNIDKAAGMVAMKINQLDMPTALLVQNNPMLALLQDKLPQRFVLDKDVEISGVLKEKDVADITFKKLNATIKDLGAVAFSGELLDIDMASGKQESLVRKLDLAVTDGGVMNIGFMVKAALDGGGDPDAQRITLADTVEAQRKMMPGQSLKDVNAALVAFLKNPGGTIRLIMAPEKPVTPRDMRRMIMSESDKLGISSSFTPGK